LLAAGPMPPKKKPAVSAFEDDWKLIDELLKDATVTISDDEADSPFPGTCTLYNQYR
jgi:hypothetical protein